MKQGKLLKGMALATTMGLGFFAATSVSAAEIEHLKGETKHSQIEEHVIHNTMKINMSYMLSGEVITIIHGNPQHIKLKRKQIHFTQPGTYIIQAKGCLGTIDTYVFKITK